MNLADSLLGKDMAMAERASSAQPGARVHRLADDRVPDATKRNAEREAWHGKKSAEAAKHLPPVVAQPTKAAHAPNGLRIDPPSKEQMPAKFAEHVAHALASATVGVTTTHDEPPAEIPAAADAGLLASVSAALGNAGRRGLKLAEFSKVMGREVETARIAAALKSLQDRDFAHYDESAEVWRDQRWNYREPLETEKPKAPAGANGSAHKLPEAEQEPVRVAADEEIVLVSQIDAALRAAGARGLTRTQIRDALGRNVAADRIEAVLEILLADGTAFRTVAKTGGRPSELWRHHHYEPEPVRVAAPDPDDEETVLYDSLALEGEPPVPLMALIESLPPAGPMPEKKLFALTMAITAMLEFFYGAA